MTSDLSTLALAAPLRIPLRITAGYGKYPTLPGEHYGIDYAAPEGTPVYAAADGLIAWAGWTADRGGFGNHTRITHPAHDVQTIYGHMSQTIVQPGQHVTRGQQIGLTGSTGNSTGGHLHFELRRAPFSAWPGCTVNPAPYLGRIIQPTPAPPKPSPPKPGPVRTYTVRAGDTLISIAARYGIDWRVLRTANLRLAADPRKLRAGAVLVIPGKPAPRTYVVRAGDTLSGIAVRYGCTTARLFAANRAVIGPNPNAIRAGMTLRLP